MKSSDDDILRILDDPDTHFTVTPEGVMEFAGFMHRVGILKVMPESWRDVFVPEIADRPGS